MTHMGREKIIPQGSQTNKYWLPDEEVTIEVGVNIQFPEATINYENDPPNYAALMDTFAKASDGELVHLQQLEHTDILPYIKPAVRYIHMKPGWASCRFETMEYTPHMYKIGSAAQMIIHDNVFEIRKRTNVDDQTMYPGFLYQALSYPLLYIQRMSSVHQ